MTSGAPYTVRLPLPRHAFSPRERARAADLWRLLQDVAVEASSAAGWPPERYRRAGTAFVVRAVTVVHHREARYGESAEARTWVWRFLRDTLCTREVRVSAGGEPLLSASQQWAHVLWDGERMRPSRAPASLREAFRDAPLEPSVELPHHQRAPSKRTHRWTLPVWHTWMDPLAHVNHPSYLAWADEALARLVAEAGLDPQRLVPVAERAVFHRALTAPGEVTVTTRRLGPVEPNAIAFEHHVLDTQGQLAARIRTVRALEGLESHHWLEAVP